jgi:hypothetical protein
MEYAKRIRECVKRAGERFASISEKEASQKQAPDKWSRKEILGHLIDSAANNHQRFVRAQLEGTLAFPGYEQNGWVGVQGYAAEDWEKIRELWSALNMHLAHIVDRVPPEKMTIPCRIGKNAEVTLELLIGDYIKHMEHHLKQIDPGL